MHLDHKLKLTFVRKAAVSSFYQVANGLFHIMIRSRKSPIALPTATPIYPVGTVYLCLQTGSFAVMTNRNI